MDDTDRPIGRVLSSPQAVRFSNSALPSPPPSEATKVKTPNNSRLNQSVSGNNRSRLSSAFTPFQPVMTPGYTPRGSQAGIVLLSPGRTITESLNALASNTAQQLEEIWDRVGYTPQERASQLSDLLVKFKDQCEQKISEEQTVAETFQQTIAESKEELRSLSNALKALVDPQMLRENSGQTFTDELSNLQDSLEILRADAAVAKKDLQACLDYLLESHQALGRELDEKWRDIESDLTARRREEFHSKVEETKEEISTRTGAIIQLIRDCQHLMDDLRIEGQESDSPLDRRIASSLVRSKDSSFIMASKFQTESCTGISSNAMEELTQRLSDLSKEKKKRKVTLQEMGAEIAMLWEQLQVPEEEQRSFTDSVKGLGMDTIQKGEEELQRLKAMKASMLGNLISNARDTIRDLWEETNVPEKTRQGFNPMKVEDEGRFDDDLLDQHEEHIRQLQDRLEQMKPIVRIIERREVILKERIDYEELQKDSDRLKQRGAAMARQLMEEEKMARRIKKELPRLTKHLEEKLDEWRSMTGGEEFQYRHEVYVNVMEHQEEEWAQYKSNAMQMKLKKKQEAQELEDHKYPGKRKPMQKKPLGDSNRNNRPSSRIRSRDTGEISKPSLVPGRTQRSRLTR